MKYLLNFFRGKTPAPVKEKARRKGGQFVLILHTSRPKVKMGKCQSFHKFHSLFFTPSFGVFSSIEAEYMVYC